MYVYQLVAAMVLRNKPITQEQDRTLTWSELGMAFDVTKDVIRHRLNKFKENYNIVDSDIVDGWNREFLGQFTPETEKSLVDLNSDHIPGDVMVYPTNGNLCAVIDPKNFVIFFEKDNAYPSRAKLPSAYLAPETIIPAAAKPAPETAIPAPANLAPLQFLITPMVLVVVRDGQPLTIDKTHKNFEKIQSSLTAGEWQKVLDYIDMKASLSKYSNGRVVVEGQSVTLDGNRVHGKLSNRLVNCLLSENVEALEGISNFLLKCDENPDYRVVTRIYDFIAHNDLRLDKDGNILAYKVVKSNYFDKYTGTMDNSPGNIVSLKRNQVNPVDSETCSFGLHVAAKSYIPQYGSVSGGDKVLLCQVDPKDFVSIPTDYNSMKARVCKYLVLKDVTENFHRMDDGIEA